MAGSVLDVRSGAAKDFLNGWRKEARAASTTMTDCLRRSGLEGPPATLPDLSTMTVVFETDQTNDINSLQRASVEKAWEGDSRCGRLVLVAPDPNGRKFKNQVSFTFNPLRAGENTKSCKVFANGKFHMTGVRSANEALGILALILRTIRALQKNGQGDPGMVRLVSVKVHMINTDFRLNVPLNLEALYKTVAGKYAVVCGYEPDQYPGCNIKYGETSILAFKSGCVIITGAKRMEHVSRAYAFILGVVLENPCVIDGGGGSREWLDANAKKEAKRSLKRNFVDLLNDRLYDGVPVLEKATL